MQIESQMLFIRLSLLLGNLLFLINFLSFLMNNENEFYEKIIINLIFNILISLIY